MDLSFVFYHALYYSLDKIILLFTIGGLYGVLTKTSAYYKLTSNIAKKYAIIGKKEEELVPMFKSLQAAGGTAYNDMIAVLDQAVDFVEKSGVFSEIGKSGHGFGAIGATEAKIDSIAKGYMEKDSTLGYATALAKAWEDNPELMDEYEEEAGF